jgi:hypothetical protein
LLRSGLLRADLLRSSLRADLLCTSRTDLLCASPELL